MKKLIAPLIAVMVVSIVFAGCVPGVAPPPEVEPIIIGAPIPLSGLAADDAKEEERATIFAVEDINARGGLLGRPVEYIAYDVVNWEAEYQTAGRDYLLARGVDVFQPGWAGDPSFLDIYSAPNTGGVPYLHCGVTELYAEIQASDKDKYWNFIQTDDGSKIVYGQVAYLNLVERPEIIPYEYPSKTVAIMTAELTYNIDISAGFRGCIEDNPEWEVVVDEFFPSGTLEFGVQLAKIRAANPGIIFFSGVHVPEAVAFQRQFFEDPTNSLIHQQYCAAVPEFRKMLGEQSNGILWQTIVGPVPNKEVQVYRERYIARFGEPPGECLAYNNYDMIMAWAEAVEAVGDVKDYRAICDYLIATPIKGMTYSPGGWNICPNCNTDRGPSGPLYRECYETIPGCQPGVRKPVEEGRGCSHVYFQIQETSYGPSQIPLSSWGIPIDEYMMTHYGYPSQDKYTLELEGANFQIPWWIK